MTNAITRENVQEILDRNAAAYRSKEAAMDAQERQLRLTINDNHATRTMTESQRAQKEQEAVAAELAKRQERRAELAQEGNECNAWYKFMLLVFGPLIAAGLLVAIAGTAPIVLPLLILMVAYTGLILLTAVKEFFPKHSISLIKTAVTRLLSSERS